MDLCSQWRPRENYSFRVGMQERRQLEIVLEAELVADAPTEINACKSRPRRCSGTSRHLPRSEEIEGDRPVFGPSTGRWAIRYPRLARDAGAGERHDWLGFAMSALSSSTAAM